MRLSTGITNKLIRLLNKVEDDIVKKWASDDTDRLPVLLNTIRSILVASRPKQYEMLKDDLVKLSVYESEYVETVFKGAIPVKFDMITPSREMLSSVVTSKPFEGKLLKEWVEDLDEDIRRKIRDAVRIGMVEGESIDQLTRRIRGTKSNKYKDGILEIERRHAQAMVRTAVNHTATKARELIYTENEELFSKVQWLATLDSRTCPFCQPLDLKTFPIDKGLRPPLHINCRCCTIPVVKSFKELGFDIDEAPASTRASMDGQVADKLSYNDWLKQQPEKRQNEILGIKRAEIFRGGVPVDKFVDVKEMKHFTLKDLKEKDLG